MANSLKIEHYVLGKTLGIGAFGKVKIAKHELTGNDVAIKIINKKRMKNSNMSAKIKREIKLLRYFDHPNIIRLYEVLETQSDIFVVMEHVQNGELFELIAKEGKLNESKARFFFQQIISGVEYCHNNLVTHRDLKPENILIDDNNTVKIADFGLSNLMKDGKFLKTSCGSPNYAAPEVISGKKYCGTEVDTWSCGVILFALLAGFLPFDEEVIPALFKKIREADFQIPPHFSPEAQDLIQRMLKPNASQRIRFHDIKLHPWVRKETSLYIDLSQLGTKLFQNKINEEVLAKILTLKFNFENMSETKIRDSILKRKDYSFVIAYDLMVHEHVKKQLASKLKQISADEAHTQVQVNGFSLLGVVKQILEEKTFVPDKDGEVQPSPNEVWHYGARLALEPQIIMEGITESLTELDTTYIIKAPSYRIKCFHKLHKTNMGVQTIEIENTEPVFHQHQDPNPNHHATSKHDKYTKNELVFIVQIYAIPNSKEYVVDIQRTKGHTILFLEYCQKFMNILKKKLFTQSM